MDPTTGIPAAELQTATRTLLEHVRGERADGLRPLRRRLHPLLHRLQLPRDRAAGRRRRQRVRRPLPPSSPSSRSSGCARRPPSSTSSRTRSTRGSSTRCGSSPGCSESSASPAPPAPTRTAIPGILGYQGPALSEVTGQPVRPACPVHREHDGAQERGRGRADPRERALVRARAPPAAAVHAARRDGSRGQPAGGTRGDAGDAGGARRLLRRPASVVRRRLGGLPRPDRAAELLGARGRPQHRVRGGRRPRHRDERADLGLQRRARARDDHRRARPTRCAASSTTRSPRSRSPSPRSVPGTTCADVDRRRAGLLRGERPAARTGASTSAMRSACATTRRRSSTSATTPSSSRGWSSRSSPGSTRTRSAASATRTRSSSPQDGIDILTSYPSDIESLTIAV